MKKKKFALIALTIVTLLTLSSVMYASADEPPVVGADCTTPPNLVPYADLQNCDLTQTNYGYIGYLNHANLSGAIFDNEGQDEYHGWFMNYANANGAIFRNTLLMDVEATHTSFVGADFRGADLSLSVMYESDFSGANFTNTTVAATYSPVYFDGSIFHNTIFTGAFLGGVYFNNADLRGADLRNAHFSYSPMNNADLRNANLQGARFTYPMLTGAIWGNTICPDGSNSDTNDGDNFTCAGNFLEPTPTPTLTRTITPTAPTPTITRTRTSTIAPSATRTRTSTRTPTRAP